MSDFIVVETISRALVLHYLPPEIGCIIIANGINAMPHGTPRHSFNRFQAIFR